MKRMLVYLVLLAGLLEGQTRKPNQVEALERLIEEQNKARIIIKCDGFDWKLVITAYGWGGIIHGSIGGVNGQTGLDCEKVIKDLELVRDEGKPMQGEAERPVARVELASEGKLEKFKTFNRAVVARCFIDVADAQYANQGGAEAYFSKTGRPSCLLDQDFKNRKKVREPVPEAPVPPARNGVETGVDGDAEGAMEPSRDSVRDEGTDHLRAKAPGGKKGMWPVVVSALGGLFVLALAVVGWRRTKRTDE